MELLCQGHFTSLKVFEARSSHIQNDCGRPHTGQHTAEVSCIALCKCHTSTCWSQSFSSSWWRQYSLSLSLPRCSLSSTLSFVMLCVHKNIDCRAQNYGPPCTRNWAGSGVMLFFFCSHGIQARPFNSCKCASLFLFKPLNTAATGLHSLSCSVLNTKATKCPGRIEMYNQIYRRHGIIALRVSSQLPLRQTVKQHQLIMWASSLRTLFRLPWVKYRGVNLNIWLMYATLSKAWKPLSVVVKTCAALVPC